MKSEKWYAAMRSRRGNAPNQYTKAKKLGLPTPQVSVETRKKIAEANRRRKVSDETRKKISESRKKYLRENPSKVPYLLNHCSKGPSYPERYFKKVFKKYKGIIPEFRFHTYSLDFAFPSKRIDIEIDGDQHYNDERIIKHDMKRNGFLKENGWKVIRIRWSHYQKLSRGERKNFVSSLIDEIGIIADF